MRPWQLSQQRCDFSWLLVASREKPSYAEEVRSRESREVGMAMCQAVSYLLYHAFAPFGSLDPVVEVLAHAPVGADQLDVDRLQGPTAGSLDEIDKSLMQYPRLDSGTKRSAMSSFRLSVQVFDERYPRRFVR
jgi:hypothetical protein